MNKKGRPTNSKKDINIKIRIDTNTYNKLEFCASVLQVSKSEVIRRAVHQIADVVEQGN